MHSLKLHTIHGHLRDRRIRIVLAGVGGNGSQVLNALPRLHLALRALGHPYGLHCTAYDADDVSEANVGRNIWSPSDVGQNKALLAVTRLNAYYGTDFSAVPEGYGMANAGRDCDILIGCVDTRAARAEFARMIEEGEGPKSYYIDLGNEEDLGQVVLGEVPGRYCGSVGPRVPMVHELLPEVADTSRPEINRHSCSLAVSLASQGLFINDFVARIALELLRQLLMRGQIAHHGALVNLKTLSVSAIPVDPGVWTRMGYRAGHEQPGEFAALRRAA
ncbi:MAG TPA: PRTRC system ThiF family protein [Burkholderiaceae bacterium]|nr:PRTRC system ThiF family protein [Burkholderiaceae bacterium]